MEHHAEGFISPNRLANPQNKPKQVSNVKQLPIFRAKSKLMCEANAKLM